VDDHRKGRAIGKGSEVERRKRLSAWKFAVFVGNAADDGVSTGFLHGVREADGAVDAFVGDVGDEKGSAGGVGGKSDQFELFIGVEEGAFAESEPTMKPARLVRRHFAKLCLNLGPVDGPCMIERRGGKRKHSL